MNTQQIRNSLLMLTKRDLNVNYILHMMMKISKCIIDSACAKTQMLIGKIYWRNMCV